MTFIADFDDIHLKKKLKGIETKSKATETDTWNLELVDKLYKTIIIRFEKCKLYSPFMDTILGDYLLDIQLISRYY